EVERQQIYSLPHLATLVSALDVEELFPTAARLLFPFAVNETIRLPLRSADEVLCPTRRAQK
ncbi:hypothetical protein, partial [uncultured Alistipes sp.]|uniref:hypothetical protein n=1 Tax=uncultured Alistipes sp. TaxID=538949 RepID=UPI00263098D6